MILRGKIYNFGKKKKRDQFCLKQMMRMREK